jgi:2-hydroxychromene-2-carboxylate isomerase
MSRIGRRVTPIVSRTLTSVRARDTRRWLAERRRRLRADPHRVLYFHQVDDPYSHLAAQVLAPLAARYDVEVEPHLVSPPPDDAAPERAKLEAFARKDAADVARSYGLEFETNDGVPGERDVELASRVLAGASDTFASVAPPVGRALWSGRRADLENLAREFRPASPDAARSAVAAGTNLRRRRGHYLGGMFHYGGEWYWGVDRLGHLERRLRSLGVQCPGSPPELIAPRPNLAKDGPVHSSRRLTLEFFPSLRSPYTYIAMERVYELAARLPVDLVLRPVLPMVMRGLPVPRSKRLYILLDTAREAREAGVPFGKLCDPVGRPIERAFSLYPWACGAGRSGEFLLAFCRAAFAEGVDTGRDEGLRHVVERTGLAWEDARLHLDREGWRDELERNREELFEMGLWGVPSFRLPGGDGEPDFCTWGQDRIWLVESEIRRRLAADS